MKSKSFSHAILDQASREAKARKIECLVRRHSDGSFRRILDVGTGSGFIANYLYRMGYGTLGIHAVDVTDERQVTDGFHFQLVEGTRLPFPDGYFDFIISNHVVEHVGSAEDQVQHVTEVYRCLEPGGVLYFAVPNRWQLIEPHYNLPLLSWLKGRAASACVRLLRRGPHYDCKPLSKWEVTSLLRRAGFVYDDVTLDAIRIVGEIECGGVLKKILTKLPKWGWRIFALFMPTLIFVCRRSDR